MSELNDEIGQTLVKEKGRQAGKAVVWKRVIKLDFARPGHYVAVAPKSRISKAVPSMSEEIRGSKDENATLLIQDNLAGNHFKYFCLNGSNLSIQAKDVILQMVSYGLASLQLRADDISFSAEDAPNGYSYATINLSWIHERFHWRYFGLEEGVLKNYYNASPTLSVEVGVNVSFPNLNPGDDIFIIKSNEDPLKSGKRAMITNSGVGVEVESSRSQRTETQYADGVAAPFYKHVHAHSADFALKIGSVVRQDPDHEIFHVEKPKGNIHVKILVPTDGVEESQLKMICTIQGQVVSGTWCKQGVFARANANINDITGAPMRHVSDTIHGVHRAAKVMVRNPEAANGYCYQDIYDSPERTSVWKSVIFQVSHIKKPE